MSNSQLQKAGALALCACLAAACAPPQPDPAFQATAAMVTQEKIRLLTAEAILSATPTAAPSDTATPSNTAVPLPTNTAQPSATLSPSSTSSHSPAAALPTAAPAPTQFDFINSIITVREQIVGFGGIIDIATHGRGSLDCRVVMAQYDLIAAAPRYTVSAELEAANQAYREAVDAFVAKAQGMYLDCRDALAAGPGQGDGSISYFNWSSARSSVAEAITAINQAIITAGGIP